MPARLLVSSALLLGVRGLHLTNEDLEQSDDPNHKKFHIKVRDETFNCTKFPDFCRGPFNCHLPKAPTADKDRGVATFDGHVNYQKWCRLYPRYSKPMTACVSRDYEKYGKLMYAEQEDMSKNPLRPHMLHVQSQLCFLAGHCNNTEVNTGTTVADMEQMCDKRWGRKKWAEYRYYAGPLFAAYDSATSGGLAPGALPKTIHEGVKKGLSGVFSDLHDVAVDDGIARSWATLSCGLGSYHCDVMYCQQNFCSDPSWREKHLELSWKERPVKEAPPEPKKRGGTRGHKSMEEWQVILRNKLANVRS